MWLKSSSYCSVMDYITGICDRLIVIGKDKIEKEITGVNWDCTNLE